ncbi:MAG: ligase-associated DNA damage response DEXH box helicase [Flavobacteriales bacterium]|nr:ligase-associated DNA damage response DEXH box helicase [Flavobacteriales bacterium]
MNKAIDPIFSWYKLLGWDVLDFQKESWTAYLDGKEGLINAPTGSGKTYAAMLACLAKAKVSDEKAKGVQLIWITPIRALAKEISLAATRAVNGMEMEWTVAVRNGDTPTAERQKQKRKPPNILITTPESMHLLIASKNYPKYFKELKLCVVDEWHELLGSKRAVQVELAISRLRSISKLLVWGISATIGNLEEASHVLLGPENSKSGVSIKAKIKKKYLVKAIYPKEIETFPWSGHLGLRLAHKIIPIIKKSRSTLIFTNTRSQCEIWFHHLINEYPEFAGILAMHHGSMDRELRNWVEEALHNGRLKAVVCTSSLDLGVDFRPVEAIIQIGGAKGVARFFQRAGRSGHGPGEISKIHFLPTHSLELLEAAALKTAIKRDKIEARDPYARSFDVLVQYLVTLAVSEGFIPEEIFQEIKNTFSYSDITEEEWNWCLSFIKNGGKSLYAYDEFKKVEKVENGVLKVLDNRTARRHRMSIGTIVSDSMLAVKYKRGSTLGHVEEYFLSSLNTGDVFWFAGRSLELIRIKELTAIVKKTNKKTGKIPAWLGGTLPLSSMLAEVLREKIEMGKEAEPKDEEVRMIKPIFEKQKELSEIPSKDQFLIEKIDTEDGHHLFFYPIEGKFVHEGLASLFAWRIGRIVPISFSIAYNDYGFELLSDQEVPLRNAIEQGLFETKDLFKHIQASVNANEMAKRKFRDIAGISGLIFKGYPGKAQKERHLRSSSQLFFEVFKEHEPDNLLYRQAYTEALEFQLEESRLRQALERINQQEIIITEPVGHTPFCFPIMVDRLREKMSFESLGARIEKMTL